MAGNLFRIWALLREGVERGVFPGAVASIRTPEKSYILAVGFRALLPEREDNDETTLYDLASLTKPLATTLALMKLVSRGRLSLEDPLERFFPEEVFGVSLYRKVTLREVLSHAAGFPAWRPYFKELQRWPLGRRREVLLRLILFEPPVYPPGERELYSDLGFFVLGEVVTRVAGLPFEEYVEGLFREIVPEVSRELVFRPSLKGFPRERIAPTEICPFTRKWLRGEVHDENTRVLGGVSGTAGLFGTVRAVASLLERLLRAYHGEEVGFLNRDLVRAFWSPRRFRGTWALGFDRPSPGRSSAGPFFPPSALGHLGYTGCAFWLVPETGLVAILLTNRVHPSRENQKIRAFRPRFFSEVAVAFGS